MKAIIAAALLAGCAQGAPAAGDAGPAARAVPRPGVYTPLQDVAGPSAGISKRCTPAANGTNANCTPL